MTDKLKCYATVALICAWPLINFAVHNAALLSESKEGFGIISVIFITVSLFSFSVLWILNKLFRAKNEIRYALAAWVVIILFFSYPQIMRMWDYIFNALNLSVAPHYGYGGTFLVLSCACDDFCQSPHFSSSRNGIFFSGCRRFCS